MVLETTNKLKLIFFLIYVPGTCARYNLFRPRYFEPSEDYYFQEESYPGQNDDMVKCPNDNPIMPSNIDCGFNMEVWPVYSNNDMIMFRSEAAFTQTGGGGAAFGVKIRQKFEVEPPTVCPVIEAEIEAWYDTARCNLMWEDFPRNSSIPAYHPQGFTFIHTKCPDMGDPEEVDNPNRIFTLIPYIETECDITTDNLGCLRYKICPSQSTSCKAPVLALGELGANPRFSLQVQTTGRTYNLGGYSVFKRRAYYEYYDTPLGSYQNDDACLSSMTGILSFDLNGKRCLFSYVFENAVIMFPEYGTTSGKCNSDPNTIFTIEVRQIYEPAPPNPCPVIEAEIRFRTDLTDVKCALLWGRGLFRGNNWQDFIRPVCTELDSPDSIPDNNPNRIFTLLPQQDTSIVHGQNFFDYKLCPGQNMSCGELVLVAAQFEWLTDIRVY